MKGLRPLAAAAVLALAVAGCGGDDDTATTVDGDDGGGSAADVQATQSGFAFVPETVEVAAGGSVTWTNEDDTTHTVTAGTPDEPTEAFEELSLDAGSSGSLTFPEAGSFPFFCAIHPSMVVTVEVT